MRRWRLPLMLSAGILLARLFKTTTLIDVAANAAPEGVRLAWPLLHVVFAPFTLTADWLNGGGTGDLIGFVLWALIAFVLFRLFADGPRRVRREAGLLLACLAGFGLFIWWGARWSRPIPRLVAADSATIVFDTHTHTAASHDGRSGFGVVQNANWHARAGFHAAFVTDHNHFGEARQWRLDATGRLPRMLDGEELSLSGLHIIVLGNDSVIGNQPWGNAFDSSLLLLDSLRRRSPAPYLIASLPEYSRHHWGPDLGRVIEAGVSGMEIWTTSPKAMDFPPGRRAETIARAKSLGIALFGATDMHGLGYAATVWNLTYLPGWRALSDTMLSAALLARFRQAPNMTRVIAMRRRLAATKNAQIAGVPLGLWMLLRTASVPHAMSLLLWIWGLALLKKRVARNPTDTPPVTR